MKFNHIHSCHLGPDISPEQFIPEHFFLYVLDGGMTAYDGKEHYTLQPGDHCIARKNHLVRYTKYEKENGFRKVVIALDEPFLRRFLARYQFNDPTPVTSGPFLFITDRSRVEHFVRSLEPYYNGEETIEEAFIDVKREELLLIALKSDPGLAGVFFHFGAPEKMDLQAFMNRSFRFNVSLERFAYLSGRSLSSFKRDFYKLFGETPAQWLKKKRLEEAHFLIRNKRLRSSEIYLDLGFEDLSHFSFAFKKHFGYAPTELAGVHSTVQTPVK